MARMTVLHYMQQWLGLSEQFVHGVVTGSRHRGVVLSRLAVENKTTFPHRPVRSLSALPPSWPVSALQRRLITAGIAGVALAYRADVIHIHHGYRARDVQGAAARTRLPVVLSLHGEDVTTFPRRWSGAMDGVFDWVDAVIVPSRFLGSMVEAMGADPTTLRVIPAGVDTSWFSPTPLPGEGPPEALFVGRFVEKKGVDVLLAAWADVRRRVPAARLRLLGYGAMEPLARSGGAGVEVELADPSRRAAQVRDAIRRATVVVTPSRTAADGDAETLLIVNLEAQASGRPLVTTRHGGIPEYVADGTTALVVPEADPGALADALVAVLTDRPLAERLAAAGPAWAAQWDVAACTARVDDLYADVAS